MTENEAIERIIRSACSSGKCYDACLYGEGNCGQALDENLEEMKDEL